MDVDIDSDNNNGFAQPGRTQWEEDLDHTANGINYGLGKLIMRNTPTRPLTPVVINLPANLDASSGVRVRIDWDPNGLAGEIRLWGRRVIAPARNPAAVDEGGDRIYPAFAYLLDDLRYDPETGEVVVYVQGASENVQLKTLAGVEQHGKPNERLRATLVSQGNSLATDDVKYVVANEDSFFYQLQINQALRNDLASRGSTPGQTCQISQCNY